MSRCYSNPAPLIHNHEILIDEPSNEQNHSGSRHDFIPKGSVPSLVIGKDEEDDIEDEESEFKMGRLIRQASLNSSEISTPQQTIKIMRGSSLPRYLSQNPKTNQEKVMNMRKVESMNEKNRNKSKSSMKIRKNINGGAPAIPGGWVDKGSSEDMKAQIKFWARAVAYNMHQEC